tara:strand:+ start:2421 stop:2783 length:363 start_codon:yes stop_codon:yes gene_type:complete
MKNNKAFQFCVGIFVLFLAYKLWETGWISDVLNPPEKGDAVESVDLVALFISSAISAVQLVGIVAIGLVAGLEPLAKSIWESLGKWKAKPAAGIDETKLIETLQNLTDRLDKLDGTDATD